MDLKRFPDERGSFAELIREDWSDLLGGDRILQASLSVSHPGIIRAWHRHARGQVDYFAVIEGSLKICAYDDRPGSPTRGQMEEMVLSGGRLQVARIPGHYWHGTKGVSPGPSTTLYFFNKMYDAKNPDEERRPWNDPTILNPRTGKPYDWNAPPHK